MWVLQRGHRSDGCDLAFTLCTNDLKTGDLFVLGWGRVRRVGRESISLELLMCGGDVHSILLLPLVARCLETRYIYIYIYICVCVCVAHVCFIYVAVTVWVSVGMLLKIVF